MTNVPTTTSSIPIDALQAATPPPKSSTSHLVHGHHYRSNANPRNRDLDDSMANTDVLDPLRLAPVPVAPQMQMPSKPRRTRKSAKNAGTNFERLIANHLAEHVDDRIDRRVKTGAKDLGDIANLRTHNGHKIVVECKNTTKISLSEWATETETERQNDNALAGIIAHKRHGKATAGDQWITMTLDNFIAIITETKPTQ